MTRQPAEAIFAYVGNFRIDGQGLGLAICDYRPDTGALEVRKMVAPEVSVGATHIDHARGILYCVDERSDNPDLGMGGGGRVFAFRIDPVTGDLTEINHRSSYASLASYVTTDVDGQYLLATNHARFVRITTAVRDDAGAYRVVRVPDPATTVLYRLDEDGAIGQARDVFLHQGEGPGPLFHPPAAHCVVRSPDGSFFAVCDKGTDEVLMFAIDREADALVVTDRFHEPGSSAPRYAQFHPSAPFLYVNHENEPFVTVFRHEQGRLTLVARADALPADDELRGRLAQQSDLRFSKSGDRLYVLIRGINVVSVFGVDSATGDLALLQAFRVAADNPRGCALSPDGRFLLVANVGSEDVVTLRIDEAGLLSDTGVRSSFTRPGNVAFYRVPAIHAQG